MYTNQLYILREHIGLVRSRAMRGPRPSAVA